MSLFVYGIARATDKYKRIAATEDDLLVITSGELAALVRSVSEGQQPDTNTPALIKHATILTDWADGLGVLPVPLGTILPDENALKSFLDENRSDVEDQLQYLQNKVEIGLKATWREDAIKRERAKGEIESDENSRRANNNGVSRRTDSGDQMERELRQKNHKAVEYLLDHLVRHTEDQYLKDPQLDRMMLNAVFLIDKDRLADFDDELEAIDAHFEDRILFQYAGPMPPYHFVDLTY